MSQVPYFSQRDGPEFQSSTPWFAPSIGPGLCPLRLGGVVNEGASPLEIPGERMGPAPDAQHFHCTAWGVHSA